MPLWKFLESGKEPSNERSVALLNFEDLSYKIELIRTDDTMTQDATASKTIFNGIKY